MFLFVFVTYAVAWGFRLRQSMLRSGASENNSKTGRKLTCFVVVEIVLLAMLTAEWAFALWAQEAARISLLDDSSLVFVMKVMARATEWLLIAVLVSACVVVRRPTDEGKSDEDVPSLTPSQSRVMRTIRRLAGGGQHTAKSDEDVASLLQGMCTSRLTPL